MVLQIESFLSTNEFVLHQVEEGERMRASTEIDILAIKPSYQHTSTHNLGTNQRAKVSINKRV